MSCSTISHSAAVRMMRPSGWCVHPPPVAHPPSESGPTVVPKCGFDRRGGRSNPTFCHQFATLLLRFRALSFNSAAPVCQIRRLATLSPHLCCSFAALRSKSAAFGCKIRCFATIHIAFAAVFCRFAQNPLLSCVKSYMLPQVAAIVLQSA